MRKLVAGTALALLAVLATGCTDGGRGADGGAPKAAAPSAKPSPKGESEDVQGKRAEAVLAALLPDTWDESDGPWFVESGRERVVEGVHNLSVLKKGKPYQVFVVCVGKGAVKVVVAGGGPAKTVACDGVPGSQRIASAPAELSTDITGVGGATGMVAWRVVALSEDGGPAVQ